MKGGGDIRGETLDERVERRNWRLVLAAKCPVGDEFSVKRISAAFRRNDAAARETNMRRVLADQFLARFALAEMDVVNSARRLVTSALFAAR
jgi:hypothetical protein